MEKYKYILLDNDGTLMDFKRAQAFALEETYKFFGFEPTFCEDILRTYDRCNHSWWDKLERNECDKSQLQIGRFEDFLRELSLSGNPKELNEKYMEHLGEGRFLIDGALEVLNLLSQRYKIYITTNGVAATQHNRIDNSPISAYIDGLFVSEETGFAKPNKEYFDYCLHRIGDSDRSKYVVIGDSLSSDILGANNAGIDCLWYNPDGIRNDTDCKINHIITSLYDLIPLL